MRRLSPILVAPLAAVLLGLPPAAAAPAADPAAAGPQASAPAAGSPRAAAKSPARKRTSVTVRRSRGYGFLPGYEPPQQRSAYRGPDSWVARPYGPGRRYLTPGGWQWVYGWGGARFYQGRWNGGGFGPCWTDTPIGPVWNCGK
ncbi:hypothetical protein PQJ75_21495 [Rhodoplanes sp. TEM]|uniref:YXWGXW repeat-containing protein n=1 Tax=Rhodoplanes tepidamans TaxID=200616 RepID=A0ABT5JBN4_RHOTP|nr:MULTISPECIES: hypothetical protein [Rhodoplanes]MDC7787096.1 hypothetical protein [Rhodoplanes tepidamans]MDC7986311.1 hypothetical protein [Rhodoplanes sp. TEM]MDQ0358696.1 hypothetical protein [Rhodoplanes tepidamans]